MGEDIDLPVASASAGRLGAADRPLVGGASRARSRVRIGLHTAVSSLALIVVTVLLAGRGIESEATVSVQGDMSRYLMNGVFVHDFLRDLPLADPLGYAYRYYVRYPALSLGHHGPLFGVLEAPFFAVFGVSVFSGRLFVIACLLIAVLTWFALSARLYDRRVALASAMLFATTPYVEAYGQMVMSEIPALMLVVVAAYFLVRYCERPRWTDALLFAVACILSVYARYHAVFMLPVFALYLTARLGLRGVLTVRVLLVASIVAAGVAPAWPLVMHYSRANVAWVAHAGGHTRLAWDNVIYYARHIWMYQVTPAVVVLSALGAAMALWNRDRRALLPVLWIAAFYVEITCTGVHEGRYAIFWVPAFCLLAASCADLVRAPRQRTLAAAALWGVVGYQVVTTYRQEPPTFGGYEEAARLVVERGGADSVLFCGPYDAGYFVFFVRKHDQRQSLIVLRADKVLATSSLGRVIADVARTPDDIYRALRQFGVRYVVLEDVQQKSTALEMLRRELRTGPFTLLRRIPVLTNRSYLAGMNLAVYEYVEHTAADPEAVLRMRVPLIGEEITARFGDILPPGRPTQQ
ncbi:glycosyltransferase family 39 protein [Candidatus Binatia bacterium]|nr:glycosyltransferase family 39 protein [Candidatus Binatia bacterium]